MAAGLPARTEIPEAEKVRIAHSIKKSRELIEFLRDVPSPNYPPSSFFTKAERDATLAKMLAVKPPPPPDPRIVPYAIKDGWIPFDGEFHWFWRYCAPFLGLGIALALLISQRT